MVRPDIEKEKLSIGIITALEHEYAAVKSLLEDGRPYRVPGRGAGREYWIGNVPSARGGVHQIALCLADKGNNSASSRATLLTEHFSNVESIIMVGIAGGMPNPTKVDDHVRLGDIVVSGQGGVIQYDMVKVTRRFNGGKSWRGRLRQRITTILGVAQQSVFVEDRHPPRPPSARLLEAVRLLSAEYSTPWMSFIDQSLRQLGWTRPDASKDVLVSSTNPRITINHPSDPSRKANEPRVFLGPISSANILLKDPIKRDSLRDEFGVKAAEMEASGIADTAWTREIGYLVVRGICDYCDTKKNDVWQPYAAVVAAAYARALLESMPADLVDEVVDNESTDEPVVPASAKSDPCMPFKTNDGNVQVFKGSTIIGQVASVDSNNEFMNLLFTTALSQAKELGRYEERERISREGLKLGQPDDGSNNESVTKKASTTESFNPKTIPSTEIPQDFNEGSAHKRLVINAGENLLKAINTLVANLDYAQAFIIADELDAWLLINEQVLANEYQLLYKVHILIIELETEKDRRGLPWDSNKLKYHLEKVKDVYKRMLETE